MKTIEAVFTLEELAVIRDALSDKVVALRKARKTGRYLAVADSILKWTKDVLRKE